MFIRTKLHSYVNQSSVDGLIVMLKGEIFGLEFSETKVIDDSCQVKYLLRVNAWFLFI